VVRGNSTTARRPRTRVGKWPWAGRSRGRRCTQASCGECAPRRACERRAEAAGWQVALAAAKFARLRTLDWTRVVGLRVSSAGSAPPASGQALRANQYRRAASAELHRSVRTRQAGGQAQEMARSIAAARAAVPHQPHTARAAVPHQPHAGLMQDAAVPGPWCSDRLPGFIDHSQSSFSLRVGGSRSVGV